MLTDTIAAISTGGNNTGINIIRISGEKSKNIIDSMVRFDVAEVIDDKVEYIFDAF